MAIILKKDINRDWQKIWKKLEPSYKAGGNVKWSVALEKIWKFLTMFNIKSYITQQFHYWYI